MAHRTLKGKVTIALLGNTVHFQACFMKKTPADAEIALDTPAEQKNIMGLNWTEDMTTSAS